MPTLRFSVSQQSRGLIAALMAIAMGLGLSACQSPQSQTDSPTNDATPATLTINGAGATFPAPLYLRWFEEYHRLSPEVFINYQATGSAAGIQQLRSNTIDFGASDIAMTNEEIAQVQGGVVLVPMTGGGVAIAYNLPGVETGLKLSREVLSQIFLGKLQQWNDPTIAKLNPGVTLPPLPIILVHRSDGSGTTATFTAHLSAISPAWKTQVGTGLNVQWPAGMGIKSNAGVSAQIQQAEGAIGYVDYGYAQKLELSMAALENKAGNFIEPNLDSTRKGLEAIELAADLTGFNPDPVGNDAYPIVTYSWLLLYKQHSDPAIASALKSALQWGLTEGQKLSPELGYVPLPSEVVENASQALTQVEP